MCPGKERSKQTEADKIGTMKKFEAVKKEGKKKDDLMDALPFGGFSTELSFSAPGESILPNFDKGKKSNAPSLGLKNFKNASKAGQVSHTPKPSTLNPHPSPLTPHPSPLTPHSPQR
jgi:hypothetical protein